MRWSGRCGGGSGSGAGCSSGRLLLEGSVSARAPNTGNNDVVSISLESKVLKGIAVPRSVGGVVLSEGDGSRVFLFLIVIVVLDNTLANLGKVEKTMEEIRSPEGVGRTVGNVVSEHAHGRERPTDLVGQVTDDGLRGCV